MFMDRRFYVVCVGVLLLVIAPRGAALSAAARYVGVRNCSAKACHGGSEQGNQFGIWQRSAHAESYKVLATDESRELASRAGVKGDP